MSHKPKWHRSTSTLTTLTLTLRTMPNPTRAIIDKKWCNDKNPQAKRAFNKLCENEFLDETIITAEDE